MPIPSCSGLSTHHSDRSGNPSDLDDFSIGPGHDSEQSADVVIHDYPLILVEESMAPLTAEDFLVPVRAWTSDSASTFMMGLEYDELLMTQFIVTGSDADRLSSNGWDLTIEMTPAGVICTLETSTPLPPLNGETLGFLQIDRPGNQPGQPGWGPWTIGLNPGNCEIDGTPGGLS